MISITLPYPFYFPPDEYRESVRSICRDKGINKFSGNVALFMELCLDTEEGQHFGLLMGGPFFAADALQGAAYENDNQVRALAVKYGKPVPGGALHVKIVNAATE